MKIPFIVVAGGKGLRMGSEVPKQYIRIAGKPILIHTLEQLALAGVERVVLVMELSYRKELEPHLKGLGLELTLVEGGSDRITSVRNGLSALEPEDEWVAIHDGVRPLVDPELLDRLWDGRIGVSGVVPILPVKDTVKRVIGGKVVGTVDRQDLYRVGTPQLVLVRDYRKALEQRKDKPFTDDAGILEESGYTVLGVIGSEDGFKITDPSDLERFEERLRGKS